MTEAGGAKAPGRGSVPAPPTCYDRFESLSPERHGGADIQVCADPARLAAARAAAWCSVAGVGPLPPGAMAHLLTPHRGGGLAVPDAVGDAGGGDCGDDVRIEFTVDDVGKITAAGFRARGCPALTAAASAACTAVEGKPLEAAMLLSAQDLDARLGGVGETRFHGAELAVDALASALEGWVSPQLGEARREAVPGRIAVAMSGGVDSAVAAMLLADAGHDVIGVTMRLWHDPGAAAAERSCCAPETVRLARASAHAIGIPHVTLDVAERFRAGVVEDFIAGYAGGRTPNPCVTCNGQVRFRILADAADLLGADGLASGHYAQLLGDGASRSVARAADRSKDQSYMLAGVPPDLLARIQFPLGGLQKDEVRRIARSSDLPAADAVESQEICFVGEDGYAEFLERHAGLDERPGPIVDRAGRRLGTHRGYWRYTVGQRRGIGLAGPEPHYVLETDAPSNTVVVGRRAELGVRLIEVQNAVVRGEIKGAGLAVRIRHHGEPVPAHAVEPRGGSRLLIELQAPVTGVAPGQTAAVYRGDRIVAAGTIARSSS